MKRRRRLKEELAEHAGAITHALTMMENAVRDAAAGEVSEGDRRAFRREIERITTLANALQQHVASLVEKTT